MFLDKRKRGGTWPESDPMTGGPPKDVENSERRLDTSSGSHWQDCALYISLKMYTCEHKKIFFWQNVLLRRCA